MRINLIAIVCGMWLFGAAGVFAGALCAEDSTSWEKNRYEQYRDSLKTGFYVGTPVAYFAPQSAYGVQCGYQLSHWNILASGLFTNEKINGKDEFSMIPSFGIFYSRIGWGPILFYDGISLGFQKGLVKRSNQDQLVTTFLTGVEFYRTNNNSFFFEIGTGFSHPSFVGRYDGGIVIEGGSRFYF